MARYVANVDILTETFETWLLRTNALLHSHSTEIITANSTWANTGNTSVPRNAQLYGRFVSNSIYISDSLSGGSNTSTTANLNITSNVSITGATVNSAANTRHTNTVFFEANVQANGAVVTIAPLSNAGSRATSLVVNTNTITIRSANLMVRSNTTFTAMSVVNDDTTSNTNMFGNNLNISANLVVSSLSHSIAGNTNFDAGSLFVDGTNDRVGIKTTTPDTELSIVGSANVSSSIWAGSRITSVGNTSLTSSILTATSNATSNVVSVNAANVNIDSGMLFVDSINNRVGVNTTVPDAAFSVVGQANVSGAVRLANTLTVIGAANVISTLGITGAANALSTFGVTGLTTLSGNVNTTTANASVAINVGANVNLSTSSITVGNNTVNTVISSSVIDTDGRLVVLGNTSLSNTLTVTGAASLSNTLNVTGAANLQSSANVGGTLGVTGATTLSNTLSVTGAANVLSTFGVTGAANALSTFGVTGAANALSTFGVTGLTTLSGNVNTTTANASVAINVGANVSANTTTIRVGNNTVFTSVNATSLQTTGSLSVGGQGSFTANVSVDGTLVVNSLSISSSLVIENDYLIDVASNTNLGSNTAPTKVYEFSKALYRSGKVMVLVSSGANTQMSEMVIAHNGTDAYTTVYGTVASPPSANAMVSPLGTFTSSINSISNNVELFLQQTVSDSAVKVVAHLIK